MAELFAEMALAIGTSAVDASFAPTQIWPICSAPVRCRWRQPQQRYDLIGCRVDAWDGCHKPYPTNQGRPLNGSFMESVFLRVTFHAQKLETFC